MCPPPLPVSVDRAHPLVLWAWSMLRDRSETDRRLVYEALRQRIGGGETTERQEQAERALRAFYADRGRWPSRKAYDRWRDARSEPLSWPSATLIRNAFGSWPAAIAAMGGGATPNVLSRRLTARGEAFDDGVLLAAVRDWVRHTQPPYRQKRFIAWCATQIEEGRRLPESFAPFRRVFGTWQNTLACARGEQRAEPVVFTAEDFARAPASSGSEFTTEEALHWLAWLGDKSDVPATISAERYDVLVAAFNRQAEAAGIAARAPRARVLASRFRSWPEARFRAGLCTAEEAVARRQGRYFSKNALLDACAKALLACGPEMQMRQYDAWSDDELQRLLADGVERPAVPRADTIRRRLGGTACEWAVAIEETLRCRPTVARRLGR